MNKIEKWEEEFENEIKETSCEDGYGLVYMGEYYHCKLKEMIEKYFGKIWVNYTRTSLKVKIKARKGKIVIERVKE